MQAAQSVTIFDRDRMLAIASLLRNTSRTFETVVRGSSMGTTLPSGTRIEVRFHDSCEVKPEAVLMYVANDRAVAHRLLTREVVRGKEYLITRGDASILCDVPVPALALIGIVTRIHNGQEWQPVPSSPVKSTAHRIASAMSMYLTIGLLRLHPRLAKWETLSAIVVRWAVLRFRAHIRRLIGRHSHNRNAPA